MKIMYKMKRFGMGLLRVVDQILRIIYRIIMILKRLL